MSTDVKFFTSTMVGAPVLAGTAGYLVNVLDALLVNGFNAVSIASISVSSNVATVTTSANHGFALQGGAIGPVVAVSGATPSELNGEWRIASVPAADQFTFATSGIGDGSASGTMSVKVAPLGWTKEFSGTNNAAYRVQAGKSSRPYLDVWDDATVPTSAAGRWAKIRGYESMSAVQNGTGVFPTATDAPNGLSLVKSNASSTAAVPWVMVGDGYIFYLFTFWHSSYNTTLSSPYVFGVIESLKDSDAFAGHICATQAAQDVLPSYPGTYNNFASLGMYNSTQTGKYMSRGYNGISPIACGYMGDHGVSGTMGSGGFAYPHMIDNGLVFSNVAVVESSGMRCKALPGCFQPLHARPLNHLDIITDLPDLPGRAIMAVHIAYNGTTNAQVFMDIIGPWR